MLRLSWPQRQAYYKLLAYQPVSESALAAHKSDSHRVLVAGGEDGGKSYWTAYELGPNVLAPPDKKGGRIERTRLFTIAGPTYSEPRKEFEYLQEQMDQLNQIDDVASPKDGQWRMALKCGNLVETRSLEDVGSIRAYKPDGIAIVEAGKCQKEAIDRLIGRGSAYDAFMVLSGTFERSQQWYHDWYRLGRVSNNGMRLESYSLPTWENVANYPQGRTDAKILEMERLYMPDYFLERCAAIPVPPTGLVLKSFDPKRHLDATLKFHASRGPVYLWVDPGYGGAYAVEAFQVEGRKAYGVDEIYAAGLTTEEVIRIAERKPWWPHVARINTVDFAARQHQASESVIEQWLRIAGVRLEPPVPRPVRVFEAIERLQTSLHQDQMVVTPALTGFLKEANIGEGPVPGMTPWRFKTTLDGTVVDRDSTTGFNHASMAIAYGLIAHFGFAPRRLSENHPVRYIEYPSQEPKSEQYADWKKIRGPVAVEGHKW